MTYFAILILLAGSLRAHEGLAASGSAGGRGRVHAHSAVNARHAVRREGRLWSGPDNPIVWHDNRPVWLLRNQAELDSVFG